MIVLQCEASEGDELDSQRRRREDAGNGTTTSHVLLQYAPHRDSQRSRTEAPIANYRKQVDEPGERRSRDVCLKSLQAHLTGVFSRARASTRRALRSLLDALSIPPPTLTC
jgi:hypothetical protein